MQRYGTVLALAAICAGFAVASPGVFLTPGNLINVTQQMALLTMVAIAATVVLSISEFDLSVSAMASFAGIAAVAMLQAGAGLPLALLAPLLACLVFGAVSGVLVSLFSVPSFIATLAMGTILGGVTFWISDGATLFGGLPDAFRTLARGTTLGAPTLSLWMLAAIVVFAVVMDRTELGRRLYAIGGNREAALLAGVPVRRDVMVAFAVSAVLCGLVGILLAARLGSAHPTGGGGFLLTAYAAAFLGTTAFRHGEPNVLGTVVGAAIIAVLANGLTILNVPTFLQDMLTGAIIILAVVLRQATRRRRAR